jgi:thiamine-phosphate pyrophosphorylase
MAETCFLYYITDRTAFPGDEPSRRRRLLKKITEAARAGVDYIQLREKDLPTRELEHLARQVVGTLNKLRTENRELRTALLVNSRTDVAIAVEAEGVHLRSYDVSPQVARGVWHGPCGTDTPARQLSRPDPVIGVSCHSPEAVAQAGANGATFAVFAPVFEKQGATTTTPAGLEALREAAKERIPVLALGGITLENAPSCLQAGAAGIAAIRLFQENNIAEVIQHLCHI